MSRQVVTCNTGLKGRMNMKFRKLISAVMSAVFLVSSMGITAAATPETVQDKLGAIEKDTYGTVQTGALVDRINKLEKDYDGTHRSGSMMARVNAIYDEVYTNSTKPSLLADLNAVEWNIGHEVSMEPVDSRMADLEMSMTGKTGTGTYKQRLASLSKASFGTAVLPLEQVRVPAETLIKVALVTPVDSDNLKVGDTIRYKIADDVIVNGKLVFAKGLPGEGTVTKVKQARNFGRNAEVNIDFNKTKSIDAPTSTPTSARKQERDEEPRDGRWCKPCRHCRPRPDRHRRRRVRARQGCPPAGRHGALHPDEGRHDALRCRDDAGTVIEDDDGRRSRAWRGAFFFPVRASCFSTSWQDRERFF